MASRRVKVLGALAVAVVIYAVMDASIRDTAPWHEDAANGDTIPSDQQLDEVADGLFRKHVVAFEILGVLLTAAMIGALVIARPLTGAPDAANYPKLTKAQLDSGAHAADIADHTGTGHGRPSAGIGPAAAASAVAAAPSAPPTSTDSTGGSA